MGSAFWQARPFGIALACLGFGLAATIGLGLRRAAKEMRHC
ncbi:hypothetical protein [uncultured Nitratireductor sp.]|nr:hypothetical protein [uncultured Nitratireductor sp.]